MDRARMTGPPFARAPLVTAYLAVSPTGTVAVSYDVAYELRIFSPSGELLQEIHGCEGTIGNGRAPRGAEARQFFFRPFTHDLAFGRDGLLYHLTQTADNGYHLLDRFTEKGARLRPILVPGRVRGGTYLAALLPTSRPNLFWSYNPITGQVYRVNLAWEEEQ